MATPAGQSIYGNHAQPRRPRTEWRASVKARTGSEPTSQYFDLLILLDNDQGRVTEFP
jgi:hypothetical protein